MNDLPPPFPTTAVDGCKCDSCEALRSKADPLSEQVGGDHYRTMPIQPIEFITKNGLNYIRGAVIKYVCRDKSKNGAEDIRKAIHCLQLLLKLEYGE